MRRITYSEIREAMGGEAYPMSLVGEDALAVIAAVNQGIDSHLEAITTDDSSFQRGERRVGDKVLTYTLECSVGVRSMPVLLRRLLEDFDSGYSLATSILGTLGFNDLDCVEIINEEIDQVV